ncbi:MAG: phosphatase PAP2 family protein [Bacteroidales bacterium]|nr:phosphatase PAP2 family protein [Bacteroidales bacterium]
MLTFLSQLDTELFLLLNNLHTPWLDPLMWFLSLTKVWIPFYLLLAAWIVYIFRKKSWVILLAIGFTIFLSDRISSGIIKPTVCRLRPSHNPELQDKVHIVNNYRGGKYGFVSSHAANTFALAMFLSLLLKKRKWSILFFIWAILVSYSRIYLGVHYPGDIIAAAILGMAIAYGTYNAIKYLPERVRPVNILQKKNE